MMHGNTKLKFCGLMLQTVRFRIFLMAQQTTKRRKATGSGHILHRNYHTKQDIEETIEGKTDMRVRRGRRHKQLLDDLMERRGYCNLKYEALDCTVWRTSFRRHHEPVVRQMTERIIQ
jgi:hypothetical protein